MIDFSHSAQESKEFARLALAFIEANRIEQTPLNYAVAYSFIAGEPGDLQKALTAMLANGSIDNGALNELYDAHLCRHNRGELGRVRDQVSHLLTTTLDQLSSVEGDLGEYGRSLQTFTASLGESLEITDISEVFQNIIAEVLLKIESEQRLTDDLDRAQQAASRDALTGLNNRGHFDHELDTGIEQTHEASEPLALLLLDIDHFKSVNDTWGHQAGDDVIRAVAEKIQHCIKGRDIAARYGGEEFAVILPGTRLENALTVAEQIRAAVETAGYGASLLDTPDHAITISVGAAGIHPEEVSGSLIRRTDAALYCAKESGRNQVCSELDLQSMTKAG